MTLYRRARIGTLMALLAILAAGCGGSGPTTVKTTLPKATTTSTQATTTTTVNPDEAKATAALLMLSDLPTGWTASTDPNSSNSSGLGGSGELAQLAACLGVPAASLDTSAPQASSPTFTDANQSITVDDQVQVFPTTAAAASDFSLFASPKTPGCLTQLFNGPLKAQFASNLQPGQTLVSVSGAAKSIPHIADHSGDVQMTFVIGQAGVNVKVLLDLVVVTKGRSETQLTLTQPQVLAIPTLGVQLARVAGARMSA